MDDVADASKPPILLLCLDSEVLPIFDSVHEKLLFRMTEKAHLARARSANGAQNYLSRTRPMAIFIPDPAITERKNASLLQAIIAYVRGGGTAVLGGTFSSFVQLDKFESFFKSWDLPWKKGDYHRTTVYLNHCEGATALGADRLELSYSQKAVFLQNVKVEEAIYVPDESSHTESRVFTPSKVDVSQTPVAYTKIGSGWLGYVGDVNAEEGSYAVIMAMCGL